MKHNIYIVRKGKVYLPEGVSILPEKYIVSMLKNIESLGFGLTKALAERIRTLSYDELQQFYTNLLADLKSIVGYMDPGKFMYPNFPQQVIEAPADELYANALLHYLGDEVGLRIVPQYETNAREALRDPVQLRIIGLGTQEEFDHLFTELLQAKSSLSSLDKFHISWFVANYGNEIERLIPETIPQKETIAYVGSQLLLLTTIADAFLDQHIRTATDVLRLAVAMSSGDISLAEKTKFMKFNKPRRKTLLRLLERSTCSLDDMLKYKERWKRLGEKLHPFEYKTKFPRSYEAFDVLRNDKPYVTFYGEVDAAIKSANISLAVETLAKRPGELARRLDHLLRLAPDEPRILTEFDLTADRVATPVLLQLYTHFQHRDQPKEMRVFLPKGEAAKAYGRGNNLAPLPQHLCKSVQQTCRQHLMDRFKKLPPLGRTFISDELRNYTVPFAMRSASKALRSLSRGSRLSLPEGNTIRFFLWWRDGKGRADIDLSALGLDNEYSLACEITYYNLKELGGYHSGDITSAPEGASEFIDVDVAKFVEAGIRYVVVSVNSFTMQPFCNLPECFTGIMIRQFPNSGEVYEPRTVQMKIDLTSATRACIPMVIDLERRELIWTDLGLTREPFINNARNTLSTITVLTRAMTSLVKTSLYDLFTLHTEARGERVFEKQNADTIFAIDEGITPFDTQRIASSFL
jgi:stress response protein SCP2